MERFHFVRRVCARARRSSLDEINNKTKLATLARVRPWDLSLSWIARDAFDFAPTNRVRRGGGGGGGGVHAREMGIIAVRRALRARDRRSLDRV